MLQFKAIYVFHNASILLELLRLRKSDMVLHAIKSLRIEPIPLCLPFPSRFSTHQRQAVVWYSPQGVAWLPQTASETRLAGHALWSADLYLWRVRSKVGEWHWRLGQDDTWEYSRCQLALWISQEGPSFVMMGERLHVRRSTTMHLECRWWSGLQAVRRSWSYIHYCSLRPVLHTWDWPAVPFLDGTLPLPSGNVCMIANSVTVMVVGRADSRKGSMCNVVNDKKISRSEFLKAALGFVYE